jgi:integrase
VLTDDDRLRLLKARDGKRFEDRRAKAIFMLLFDCGIRRAEMAGLGLEDEDFESVPPSIVVLGKGQKRRRVQFSDETAMELIRYLKVRQRHRFGGHSAMFLGLDRESTTRCR